MPGASDPQNDPDGYWAEQLQFKTPIKIEEGHSYSFKVKLAADKPFSSVIVKLTDNDDDDIELAYEEVEIEFKSRASLYLEENPFNRSMRIGKPKNGKVTVKLKAEVNQLLFNWIVSFTDAARVIKPVSQVLYF